MGDIMSYRVQRNRVIRKSLEEWIDTLEPGYEFTLHDLTKKYDKNAISLGNIIKEFNGTKIKISQNARGLYDTYRPTVWMKI